MLTLLFNLAPAQVKALGVEIKVVVHSVRMHVPHQVNGLVADSIAGCNLARIAVEGLALDRDAYQSFRMRCNDRMLSAGGQHCRLRLAIIATNVTGPHATRTSNTRTFKIKVHWVEKGSNEDANLGALLFCRRFLLQNQVPLVISHRCSDSCCHARLPLLRSYSSTLPLYSAAVAAVRTAGCVKRWW